MRIKQVERGYTLFVTEHEFAIMNRIMDHVDTGRVWLHMSPGERQSWARRTRDGDFLRVDADYRLIRE